MPPSLVMLSRAHLSCQRPGPALFEEQVLLWVLGDQHKLPEFLLLLGLDLTPSGDSQRLPDGPYTQPLPFGSVWGKPRFSYSCVKVSSLGLLGGPSIYLSVFLN